MTIANTLKQQISLLNDTRLEEIILKHVQSDASDLKSLFTKHHENTRKVPNWGRAAYSPFTDIPYENPLSMVFAFAPEAVCKEISEYLTHSVEKRFTQHLSNLIVSDDEHADERVMHTLMHYAPNDSKKLILQHMQKLGFETKKQLLLQPKNVFECFLDLLNKHNDSDINVLLISTLKQLGNEQRMTFFISAKGYFSNDYDGVIHFFRNNTQEKSSIALLSMLSEHFNDDWAKLFIRTAASDNIFPLICEHQSLDVILKFVLLMQQKLSKDNFTKFMEQGAEEALEKTLLRSDKTIAPGLIRHFATEPQLSAFLTKTSLKKPSSVMHHAVELGHIPAVTTYLEQPTSQLDHTVWMTNITMQDLIAKKDTAMAMLFQAHSVYRSIITNQDTEEENQRVIAVLQEHPEVVDSIWDKGNSLLHLATERGQLQITTALLKAKASSSSLNIQKLNPLQLALQTNQTAIVELFLQPEFLSLESITTALQQLNINVSINRIALHNLLGIHSQNLAQLLSEYKKSNDTNILFLARIGKLVATQPQLLPEIDAFIQRAIRLSDHSNITLPIVILIFTMSSDYILHLKEILNPATFENIIAFGLSQPAIYAHLEERDFEHYFSCISPQTLKPILTQYCLSNALIRLPLSRCIEIKDTLAIIQLKRAYQDTRNPLLLTLTIEKMFSENVGDAFIQPLIKEFNDLLQRYQQNPTVLTEKELYYIFNMAKNPNLVAILSSFCRDSESHLAKKLQQFITDFTSEKPLLENSFLRNQLIANTHKETLKPMVYEQFLSIASDNEINDVFAHLRSHADTCLAADRHLLPNVSLENKENFEQWLYSRSILAKRSVLLVHFDTLTRMSDKIKKAANVLEDDQYPSQLLEAQQLLERIANHLSACYSNYNAPIINPSLSLAFTKLRNILNILHQNAQADHQFQFTEIFNSAASIHLIEEKCQEIDRYNTPLTPLSKDPEEKVRLQTISQYLQRVAFNKLENPLVFNEFSQWFLHYPETCLPVEFYQYLSQFSAEKVVGFESIVALRNQSYADTLPLLSELSVALLNASISPEQLIKLLYQQNITLLQQFKEVCVYSHAHDVIPLLDNIIAAKNEAIPELFLTYQQFLPQCQNIKTWIEAIYTQIEQSAAQNRSLLFLITASKNSNDLKPILNWVDAENGMIDFKATVCFMRNYFSNLKSDTVEDTFLTLTHTLLRQCTPEMIYQLLSELPPKLLEIIAENAVNGLASGDKEYVLACQQLLTHICQHRELTEKKQLEQIKNKLGAQDLHLLKDSNLQALAKDILAEFNAEDLQQQTINGIWIQRLLTNPRFVAKAAQCDPNVLQMLSERYRLISLTLKQDEFECLNAAIKDKIHFFDRYHVSFSEDEKRLREHLVSKRQRLLQFRADDSVRALFVQLEENCFAMRQVDNEVADAALNALYKHYNDQLGGFHKRSLFNWVHSLVTRDKGDLQQANSPIINWINTHLPHYNFVQNELNNKQSIYLYDNEGKQIAFLNDSGQVMVFVDDIPCPILKTNVRPGTVFYDVSGKQRKGELLPSGMLKHENLFQQQTSSLLLASVPTAQLQTTPDAIALLMDDMLAENQLHTFYAYADKDKCLWLDQQLSNHMQSYSRTLSDNVLKAMVEQQDADSLFACLASMQHTENAYKLFEIMLQKDTVRMALFSSQQQDRFHQFLQNHNANQVFANFLAQHHDKPGFLVGCKAFADYGKRFHSEELLIGALSLLNKKTDLSDEMYSNILTQLISSEAACEILWKDFFAIDNPKASIQSLSGKCVESFAQFYVKHMCQKTLKSLNSMDTWINSYQYRVFLLILARQDNLLANTELRYSEKQAWSAAELQQITLFCKRHLRQLDSPDAEQQIAKKLVSELIFRTANYGNIELFYNKDQFDNELATKTMQRSIFHAIIAEKQFFGKIKQKLDNALSTIKNFFDETVPDTENQALFDELKEQKAVVDWRAISADTWSDTESSTEMPLLLAYLFNYSGSPVVLNKLLNDYIEHAPTKISPLLKVLNKLPKRDVSIAVFSALETFFTQHPAHLNETAFNTMTAFYAQKYAVQLVGKSPQAELKLIEHFGMQKKYELVKRCCHLLERTVDLLPTETHKLANIRIEAKIESELQQYLDSWYFKLLKWFKHFFNYGKEASSVILFCDDSREYKSPVEIPKTIESNIKGGSYIDKQIRLYQLKKRADRLTDKMTAPDSMFFKPTKFVDVLESELLSNVIPATKTCKEMEGNMDLVPNQFAISAG